MMNESNDKKEKPEKEPKCDEEQLERLLRCSKNENIDEWNKWRKENKEEEIWLEGANLWRAYLEGADLRFAHLEGANLVGAHLEGANLWRAHLEGADLGRAHLEGANLGEAHLKEANLGDAHLERARLLSAHLEGSYLALAHLESASLLSASLQGADFKATIFDGSTLFWRCEVDRNTDFRGVGLENCRIDEGTKHLLEYNRRRMNSEEWYEKHPRLARPVKWFWKISDYGHSTWRIINTFFKMAIFFAIVYYVWGAVDYYLLGVHDYPGIVNNLFVLEDDGHEASVFMDYYLFDVFDYPGIVNDISLREIDGHEVSPFLVPFRAIYFSVVTMTTLGFGDMYANAHSFLRGFFGHLLLSIQVLLGYILLGAMVTRFGVLFRSGVVHSEFAEEYEESEDEED